MTIAFHSYQLSIRGTEIALYDYAHYSEKILGHKSIVTIPEESIGKGSVPRVIEKFKSRFPLYFYKDLAHLEEILAENGAELFYSLRAGHMDHLLPQKIKSAVHVVFQYFEPHGNVYAYVSEWLSNKMTAGKYPFVPHMVHMPDVQGDMREQLGIPASAKVFGRYGGPDTFDIHFVKQAIYEIADANPDIYFLFMNTDIFLGNGRALYRKKIQSLLQPIFYPKKSFPNIIFLPGTESMVEKRKFINTCDAMVHAQWLGETFGLAIGEFSVCGKPIITCNHPTVSAKTHLEILGERAISYSTKEEFKQAILSFQPDFSKNWDAYSEKYGPEPVMKKFENVFIHG